MDHGINPRLPAFPLRPSCDPARLPAISIRRPSISARCCPLLHGDPRTKPPARPTLRVMTLSPLPKAFPTTHGMWNAPEIRIFAPHAGAHWGIWRVSWETVSPTSGAGAAAPRRRCRSCTITVLWPCLPLQTKAANLCKTIWGRRFKHNGIVMDENWRADFLLEHTSTGTFGLARCMRPLSTTYPHLIAPWY